MSFKIFTLQLLGKIKPVEIIENQREKLQIDFNEFQNVDNSEELKKYKELESWINSDEFKSKKAEIEALQFKGSKEFNQLNEFVKLSKASSIKKYFKVSNSLELKRFVTLKGAEKLGKYDKLLEYMKEGQFEKEKKAIKGEVFKGSVEETHLLDFKKLDKSAGIKAYKELAQSAVLKKHEAFSESEKLKGFIQLRNIPDKDTPMKKELKVLLHDSEIKAFFKFEKSKKLKLFRETDESHDLKKYNELKAYVENEEFKKREVYLKDKKKFDKSETFKKLQEYKALAADADIKFFLKFEKSALYKNYLDVTDSFDLKRYLELEEITTSKEFAERKAYLEDKKKWEKTEEFAKQQEFLEMKKLPYFIKYFKYKNSTDFEFLNNWEIVFEDDFSSLKLDEEKWSAAGFLANKLLGDNYSMPGDLHVLTKGDNIKIKDKLTIEVKKEKKIGKVWQMPAGFVPTELDYTSGIVSSWNSFWQEDGIFEAKIKFNPVKEIVSSFYLTGESNSPRVNLLEMGTKNQIGISKVNEAGKMDREGMDISNLKKGKPYIFTFEKSGKTFIWKINESEVFRVENSEINYKLHLNASSIVVFDLPGSKLPVDFEINWVKCYRKK